MDDEFWNEFRPKPKRGARNLLIFLIILLVIANAGLIGVFWFGQNIFTEFAQSAKRAAQNSLKQNPWAVSADFLPGEDVKGREIDGIARYPKAVRTNYRQSPINGMETVEYASVDKAEQILGFYKTQMAQKKWVLLSSATDKILFEKDGDQIEVEIEKDLGLSYTSFTVKKGFEFGGGVR